jgi:penicillin-binding protein 1A
VKPTIRVTNPRRGGRWGAFWRAVLILPLWGAALASSALGLVYVWLARDLPRLDTFDELTRSSVTRILAADGTVIGEYYEERRIAVRWEDLPPDLVLAFLAAEDARFFEHDGVDFRGVLRAVWINLRAGRIEEGASTITQQLAKTLVGPDRTFVRKVREAILARRIEDLYTKPQILTWYLNAIYLGHGSHGVRAAAENYFRKPLDRLTLAEMAMLAGVPPAPGRVNPVLDPPRARERMQHVLDQMLRRGWIGANQALAARAEVPAVYPREDPFLDQVPTYAEHMRRQLTETYPDGSWLARGLTVSTHAEIAHQWAAEASLDQTLVELQKKQGWPGALGRLDRDRFLASNRPWLMRHGTTPGTRLLARVAEVSASQARLEIGETVSGTLRLAQTRWASEYTELPVDANGRRETGATVSFKGRLDDLRRALAPAEVVMVEVVGGAGAALDLALVPVPMMEGALVSYPTVTGGVDTLVGGWDHERSEVHRVFALRQTGSTMKPLVYAKAYDLGLPPSALFSGAPFFDPATGYTMGGEVKGDMLVFDALTASENVVSIRVLEYVLSHTPAPDYQSWGARLGLARPLTGMLSEVLGADQTAWSMAHAFGLFAQGGIPPRMAIARKVTDTSGRVLVRDIHPGDPYASFGDTVLGLWQAVRTPLEHRLDRTTAWLVSRNLREAVLRGTGTRARKLGREVAGKTGTLPYDVWFDGFTSTRVALCWVGADRRERPLGRSEKKNLVYGSNTALPAWLGYMREVDAGRKAGELGGPRPPDVTEIAIDPGTGLLADKGGEPIPHRRGTEPTRRAKEPAGPARVWELEGEF